MPLGAAPSHNTYLFSSSLASRSEAAEQARPIGALPKLQRARANLKSSQPFAANLFGPVRAYLFN